MRRFDNHSELPDPDASRQHAPPTSIRNPYLSRRRFVTVSLGVAGATLLAACGGDDDEPPAATTSSAPQPTQPASTSGGTTAPTTTTSVGSAATPAAAASPTTATAAQGRPGGKKIFKLSWPADVQNMDSAHITTSPDNQAGEAVFNYMARYTYNPPLGTEILPDLAEKWDVTPDAKVFTFYIHRNAKFHRNYGDATAEDVKWNWERIQNEATGSRFRTDFLGGTFQAVDAKTLKATFEKSYPTFIPAALGYVSGLIMSKKAYEELGDLWKTNPVGTGPFTWGKYEPGSSLTLDRWPDYWGTKPKVDQIYMKLRVDPRSALLAIATGELDAAYIDDPDIALDTLRRPDPNTTLLKPASGQATYWIAFNMKRPPLDNVKVRQALRYAIDQDAIAKELYGGLADPLHSFLPSFMFGFSDDVMKFNYDPDKAKSLLREAGVDLNTWQPSLLGSQQSTHAKKQHEVVASYWTDVGVKVSNELDEQAIMLRRRAAGEYDMFGIGVGRIEPDQIATAYWRTGSTVNNSFYSGADDLIDAARAEPDRQKRADLYKQAQQKVAIDSPAAFLVSTHTPMLINKRVVGITGAAWLSRYDWFNVDVPAE